MIDKLVKIVSEDNIGHGYLFIGSPDECKENAIEFAMSVNCQNSDEGVYCGECLSCRKIRHGNHPDIIFMEPEKKEYTIGQIRALQTRVTLKHHEGEYKVIIMEWADYFNDVSGNGFLKLLEEPPHKTIFILIARNLERILPTIESRCQVIKFQPKEVAISSENLAKAYDILNNLADKDVYQLFIDNDSLNQDRQAVKSLVFAIEKILRNNFVGNIQNNNTNYMVLNADIWDNDKVYNCWVRVSQLMVNLEYNVNIKLFIDVLMMELSFIINGGIYGKSSRN